MKGFSVKVFCAVLSALFFNISAAVAAEPGLIGKPAPSFTLKTIDGADLTMESLKGKGVVLNFWATWCAPCKTEMPTLEDAYKRHGGKSFTVIGVNYQQEESIVRRYLQKNPLSFPIILDTDGALSEKFEVLGLPATFFIDRDGTVVGSHVGLLEPEQLQEWVSRLTAP